MVSEARPRSPANHFWPISGAAGGPSWRADNHLNAARGWSAPMAKLHRACYIRSSHDAMDPKFRNCAARRFRPIPVRMLVPTSLPAAICAGLTAIRLSIEGRMELAVAAIVFAAILDGVDGRVRAHDQGPVEIRRRTRQPCGFRQFRRCARPDAVLLATPELNNGGWIAAMVFATQAVCGSRGSMRPLTIRTSRLCGELFHRRAGAGRRHLAMLPFYSAFLGTPKPPATLTRSIRC